MTRAWMVAGAVVAAAIAAIAWSQWSDRGTTPIAQELAATTPRSCKPTVPLSIDLQPLAPGRWRVQCASLDQDRDVIVWMWSGSDPVRSQVWRGLMRAGAPQTLELSYAPADPSAPVWAAVEAPGRAGEGMQSVTVAAQSGQTLPSVAAEAGQLQRDPATGEVIRQYTGQTEAGR